MLLEALPLQSNRLSSALGKVRSRSRPDYVRPIAIGRMLPSATARPRRKPNEPACDRDAVDQAFLEPLIAAAGGHSVTMISQQIEEDGRALPL